MAQSTVTPVFIVFVVICTSAARVEAYGLPGPSSTRDDRICSAIVGYSRAMRRTIVYWSTTAIVTVALLGSLSYLTGSEQVVSGFAKAGYPQHLRIVLGIAKPAAAIVLLLPGLALPKEWAYAGAAFAWIMAFISAYASGEPPQIWSLPPALLALLIVSYLTRPSSRRASGSVTGGRRADVTVRPVI